MWHVVLTEANIEANNDICSSKICLCSRSHNFTEYYRLDDKTSYVLE